jgi:hypothetical protein
MSYRMPLAERTRHAANRRWRYSVDPAYRLACINSGRARRGAELLASVDALPALAPMACPGKVKGAQIRFRVSVDCAAIIDAARMPGESLALCARRLLLEALGE